NRFPGQGLSRFAVEKNMGDAERERGNHKERIGLASRRVGHCASGRGGFRTAERNSAARWIGLALFLLAGSLPPAKAAEDPAPLFTAAREAVARTRLAKSRLLGFHNQRKVFSEVPAEGAILIGFDLGVGKFFDIETVYAL